MADVVIIGAGIAGLAAAWELSATGLDVVVLEATGALGGKVRTEHRDGFLIEHGPDSVVSYRPAALDLIGEVGLADEVVTVGEPRSVFLRVSGQLRPMPEGMGLALPTRLGPFVRTRVLSWPQKLRAAGDLVLPRVVGEADMSVGALLRRRLGDGVADRLVEPLLGGVYGASIDELSMDAVVPTLRTSEAEHRSLMLASLAQGRAARRAGAPGGSPFRSLRRGLGSLVDALVTALGDRGVVIRTDSPVTAVDVGDSGAEVRVASATGPYRARSVILACGPRATARLLAPLAPAAARELRAIPMGTTSSVSLGYDASAFPDGLVGHGYLEAGPDRPPISGLTIASNKWPGRAPADAFLVRAFVPNRVGALAGAPDQEIVAAVTHHVGAVLGARRAPTLRHIVRWPEAMPTYVVGHQQRVRSVESALPRSVRVAGSTLHGVGVPDCVADGRRVAAAIASLEAPRG